MFRQKSLDDMIPGVHHKIFLPEIPPEELEMQGPIGLVYQNLIELATSPLYPGIDCIKAFEKNALMHQCDRYEKLVSLQPKRGILWMLFRHLSEREKRQENMMLAYFDAQEPFCRCCLMEKDRQLKIKPEKHEEVKTRKQIAVSQPHRPQTTKEKKIVMQTKVLLETRSLKQPSTKAKKS